MIVSLVLGTALLFGTLKGCHDPTADSPAHVIHALEMDECVAALRREQVFVVRKVGDRVDATPGTGGDSRGVQSPGVDATVRSRGLHDRGTKARVRSLLDNLTLHRARQLRAAIERNDLREEAQLREANEHLRIQIEMLDRDDYLVFDKGASASFWPQCPKGWIIYKTSSHQIDGGVTETVFPICLERDARVVAAMNHTRQVEDFLAMDAAFRFNGLDDSDRARGAAVWTRVKNGNGGPADPEEQRLLHLIDTAGRGGRFIMDATRSMLRPR